MARLGEKAFDRIRVRAFVGRDGNFDTIARREVIISSSRPAASSSGVQRLGWLSRRPTFAYFDRSRFVIEPRQ